MLQDLFVFAKVAGETSQNGAGLRNRLPDRFTVVFPSVNASNSESIYEFLVEPKTGLALSRAVNPHGVSENQESFDQWPHSTHFIFGTMADQNEAHGYVGIKTGQS